MSAGKVSFLLLSFAQIAKFEILSFEMMFDLKTQQLVIFKSVAASLMTTAELSFERRNEDEWKTSNKVV